MRFISAFILGLFLSWVSAYDVSPVKFPFEIDYGEDTLLIAESKGNTFRKAVFPQVKKLSLLLDPFQWSHVLLQLSTSTFACIFQIRITILYAENLAEKQILHNHPLDKADVVLVYNTVDHFVAAGD